MHTTQVSRALVEQLEVLARERPRHYRFRVVALAFLGLGYRALLWTAMFVAPVALTAAFYPTTWSLTFVAVLLLLFGVYGFRPPPIEGLRLHRSDAPELFAELEAMRAKTGAPRVDEVILDGEFNASAALVPRLGLFGWHKQVLTLGVPLLATLSRGQALAIVGHELGHFSKAHGRLGQWVYRTRYAWEKLQAQIGDENSGLGAAVNQFYRSFVPYFCAYSFVLSRLCEYEADADAARASDPATAASALAALYAYDGYLERSFWPAIWRTPLKTALPPADVYRQLAEAARSVSEEDLEAYKRKALLRSSDLADTHPCLADRLRGLQIADVRLAPPAICAGQALMGPLWEKMLDEASKVWSERVAREWSDARHRLEEHARQLAELRAVPAERGSLAGRMEVARLTDSLEGPEAAVEQWRALHAEAPGDARIAFQWALALVRLHDRAAFAELEALATRELGYAAAATGALKDLALSLGDTAAADGYEVRRRKAERKAEEAEKLLLKDLERGTLKAHGLPHHAVRLLTRQLQSDGTIAGAYVAAVDHGDVKHFGGTLLVIRIDPAAMARTGGDPGTIANRCQLLAARLLEANQFAWVINFYTTEGPDAKIAAALAAIPSSRLYGNLGRPEGSKNDWQ